MDVTEKEILNDTIRWFKTAKRNNDMACILPDQPMMKNIIKWLEKLKKYESEQNKDEWIPIKYREITDEERAEEHLPDHCDYRLICNMPEQEERILVTNGESVWLDMCCIDQEGYYLDSNYDWFDLTAWKPLPKPYKENGNE